MTGVRETVVYCPGVAWTDVRGTDVNLATALSRLTSVLWVDPPVSAWRAVRDRGVADLLTTRRVDRISPTLVRVTSVGPPRPTRAGFRTVTSLALRDAIRRGRAAIGGKVVATVASTPQPRFQAGRGGLRIYYATDDFVAGASLLGYGSKELQDRERRQIADADSLVAVSDRIAQRWPATDKPVVVLPNGCDPDLESAMTRAAPAPEVRLPRPIVGVVGQLGSRLDVSILEAIAGSGTSLLLIGPLDPTYQPDRMAALMARPNVQWVGRQPPDRLPSFYACLAVGATPYTTSDFNLASVPLKSLEYVAAGLPVVSTPLPASAEIPQECIRTASTGSEFLAALRVVLAPGFQERSADLRRAFVRANSWPSRASTLLDLIHSGSAHRDDV